MKVLDLRCAQGHVFEGWFGSDEDFARQHADARIECPLCADTTVERMPSAPRLNLSGARAPAERTGDDAKSAGPVPAAADGAAPPDAATRGVDMQAAWLRAVRHLMASTEDVGERFPEEVRRMHYGERPERGIRGQATPEQREALRDEGIETVAIPVPAAVRGPVQ